MSSGPVARIRSMRYQDSLDHQNTSGSRTSCSSWPEARFALQPASSRPQRQVWQIRIAGLVMAMTYVEISRKANEAEATMSGSAPWERTSSSNVLRVQLGFTRLCAGSVGNQGKSSMIPSTNSTRAGEIPDPRVSKPGSTTKPSETS